MYLVMIPCALASPHVLGTVPSVLESQAREIQVSASGLRGASQVEVRLCERPDCGRPEAGGAGLLAGPVASAVQADRMTLRLSLDDRVEAALERMAPVYLVIDADAERAVYHLRTGRVGVLEQLALYVGPYIAPVMETGKDLWVAVLGDPPSGTGLASISWTSAPGQPTERVGYSCGASGVAWVRPDELWVTWGPELPRWSRRPGLWSMDLRGRHRRLVQSVGPETAIRAPAAMADGRALAAVMRAGSWHLVVWDVGAETMSIGLPFRVDLVRPSNADPSHVLVAGFEGPAPMLADVDLLAGTWVQLPADTAAMVALGASPDHLRSALPMPVSGRRVLQVVDPGMGQGGGSLGTMAGPSFAWSPDGHTLAWLAPEPGVACSRR